MERCPRNRSRFVLFFAVCQLLSVLFLPLSHADRTIYVPPDLEAWKKWVTHGKEKMFCPPRYNDPNAPACVWPELLQIDADASGAGFSQKVNLFAKSRVRLPGGRTLWPVKTEVDGVSFPVINEDGYASVELERGSHHITGVLMWDKLPDKITLPDSAGLVSFRLNNTIIRDPFVDDENRLWITQRPDGEIREEREKNLVEVKLFRLIEDDNPLKVETLVRLRVSGERRREKLLPVLLENSVAVSVDSPLPVKLDPDRSLWVEVQAGTWDIKILSVMNRELTAVGPASAPYGEEIWVFRPFPHIRVSRVEGPAPIDPSQSRLPEAWKRYSGYLMRKNDVMGIVTQRRGDPDASDEAMRLSRELWLDFDGRGATVRDRISGVVGKRKFIGLDEKEYEPGSISISGGKRLVTRYGKDLSGIEVERGRLDLEGVSRLKTLLSGKSFGMGWNLEFQSAFTTLHLAPGWHLFALAGGRAAERATWVDRWSMLDFFLILVVSFAVARLWQWWWGVVFLAGMILISHEPFAPRYAWLLLIVTSALYRLSTGADRETGKRYLKKTITLAHIVLLLFLVGLALAFSYVQIRSAVYPQLEPVNGGVFALGDMMAAPREAAPPSREARKEEEMAMEPSVLVDEEAVPSKRDERRDRYWVPVEKTATQTGPAIPRWRWRRIHVELGQVSTTHTLTLWITSPTLTAMIRWLRVFFLVIMVFRFALSLRFPPYGGKTGGSALLVFLTLFFAVMGRGTPAAADIPPQALLDELEKRMVEPASCFPECAAITWTEVVLPPKGGETSGEKFLEIHLDINASVETAVPLPSGSGTWNLYDLQMDNVPHRAVLRGDENFWVLVPEGVHKVKLRGYAHGRKLFRFVFPLKPSYVRVAAPDWEITGLNEYNRVDHVLQAVLKEEKAEEDLFFSDYGNLRTDFLRVSRTLMLGLEWRVRTRVERFVITDEKTAVVASIPLLEGEMVLTGVPGLTVSDGKALIELAPGENWVEWDSSIPVDSTLTLTAAKEGTWAEVWNLQLASRWHLDYKGIPVTYPENSAGSFWYPWPGEQLELAFTRLEAAPGDSFTVDSVRADYYRGRGFNRIVLKADIRTTEGREYEIGSPEGATTGQVKINGKKVPVSGSPETVSLSLQPGRQKVEVEWNELTREEGSWLYRILKPAVVIFPEIDMGREVNNIDIYIHVPKKLWLLFTRGPGIGPAVLLWSTAGVIVLAALILGRLPFSPLSALSWIILGLGLVSLDVPTIVMVAAWFMAVEIRKTKTPLSPLFFNLMQIALVLWGLFVVYAFYRAVTAGLLDIPDMQVAGNGSRQTLLRWTLDRETGLLPRPWIAVYSLYIYQVVMLLWSLWLAVKSVSWAGWAVASLREGGAWRPLRRSKGGKGDVV